MASPGSVTHWIDLLKTGDAAAAQHIWDRFFSRLVGLAQAQLRGVPCGPADGEDVASRLQPLLSRRAARPVPAARRPRRPLAPAHPSRRAQGPRPAAAPGTGETRRRSGSRRGLAGEKQRIGCTREWPGRPRHARTHPRIRRPPGGGMPHPAPASQRRRAARSPSPRWRATRTRNWPPRWVAASAPSSASSS